ncbi:MAG: helix-turn-helix transcriptional regulator [Clostridia bacterium]|nr:helix-turn-helix transcriptional regulator [Clostridia bacterium]
MSKFENNIIGNNLFQVNGYIKFHLLELLEKKHITRYALSRITNIRYDTICNYCSSNVTLINAEYLKIFCTILDCNIGDIMTFEKIEKNTSN